MKNGGLNSSHWKRPSQCTLLNSPRCFGTNNSKIHVIQKLILELSQNYRLWFSSWLYIFNRNIIEIERKSHFQLKSSKGEFVPNFLHVSVSQAKNSMTNYAYTVRWDIHFPSIRSPLLICLPELLMMKDSYCLMAPHINCLFLKPLV